MFRTDPRDADGCPAGEGETAPTIREAGEADVAKLTAALGGGEYFANRLARQAEGLGVLLTAWWAGQPVGDLYLWLEAAEEREIRIRLPGVPLLMHLEVLPAVRNRGVGGALVRAAEERLTERGHRRGALAVRTDNTDAARLYRRLGYRDWGHGTVVCYAENVQPDGRTVSEAEVCHVFVKNL
ncbi:GNAT family N-acetyltransferase [Amycolatopsis rhabdoformis]|uniref:GNAT family N-acetyltransferase n=1 Tax=Amycolatopsis rhabdoformis TaxID=1448059 RepID=A0ABZ1IAY7_9PSEU|nr:GNAT family N-acetyltransferase [Amycolatopsis rhabdoformis]WSE31113.1 GNAT family N-acetyltransferase [Amycolatopsis rhabdoformis]